MKRHILDILSIVRTKSHENFSVELTRYKPYFYIKILHTFMFTAGSLVYLEKLSPRMGSSQRNLTDSEELATANRFKLIFEKLDPFLSIKFQSHTVIIYYYGVSNLAMTDIVTLAISSSSMSTPSEYGQKILIPSTGNN